MDFAERLKAVRTGRGVSQYELARRSGLTNQALSLLELGKSQPTWVTVQRLALALDVPVTEFLDPSIALPDVEPPARPGRPRNAPATEGAATPDQAEPKRPARRAKKK